MILFHSECFPINFANLFPHILISINCRSFLIYSFDNNDMKSSKRRVTLLSLNSSSDFHWTGKGLSFFTFVSYFKNEVEYVIRVSFINTASKKWSIT